MIKHIVLLKFKETLNDVELQNLNQGFCDLAANIQQVQSYEFGPDLGCYRGNADYCLVAEFKDQSDLDLYVKHPQHQDFLTHVAGPLLSSFMSAQFKL